MIYKEGGVGILRNRAIGWDFTRPRYPLRTALGPRAQVVPANGASVDRKRGLVCIDSSTVAKVSCAPGAALLPTAYPFTVVTVVTLTASTFSSTYDRLWVCMTSGDVPTGLTLSHNSSNFALVNSTFTQLDIPRPGLVYGKPIVLIVEHRANGSTLWMDGVVLFDTTAQTLTFPTLSRTNYWRIGAREATTSPPRVTMHAVAMAQQTLTESQRVAIQRDWRSALFPRAVRANLLPFRTLRPMFDLTSSGWDAR